jgi:hypothetical protein
MIKQRHECGGTWIHFKRLQLAQILQDDYAEEILDHDLGDCVSCWKMLAKTATAQVAGDWPRSGGREAAAALCTLELARWLPVK